MSGATAVHFESIEGMDFELGRLARASGVLRFGLGVGLEALARIGGHHELGFSSVEAYALERCERSTRWVQESRALARRLAELPTLRRSLVAGEISFSMAQTIGKVARAEDEAKWVVAARKHTVREMRLLIRREKELSRPRSDPGNFVSLPKSERENRPEHKPGSDTDDELTALTVTVDAKTSGSSSARG